MKNRESSGAKAQTYVATGDLAPERPHDPLDSAIINQAKVPDNNESDIAPAVGSHSPRAMTRRGMFMNMAVTALTGTAIPSSASTAMLAAEPDAVDDPIFAVIERHRRLFESKEEAHAHFRKLHEERKAKRDPRGVYLGEFPETKWIMEYIGGKSNIEDAVEAPTGRIVSFFATYPGQIDSIAEKHGCTEAWKTEKHQEWEQWSGRNDGNSPISQAGDAWNDAGRQLARATAALDTRPTTLAGVTALLRYVAETYSADDESPWTAMIFDDEDDPDEPNLDNTELLQDILYTLADTLESVQA